MSTIDCVMQDRSQLADLDTDVVIVGYGPVGATLANLLGLRGVRTVVLEREHSAYHLPRAVHFDDEVMRIFETVGFERRDRHEHRLLAGNALRRQCRPAHAGLVAPSRRHAARLASELSLSPARSRRPSARRPQPLAMRLDNDTMRRLCARRRRRRCSRPLRRLEHRPAAGLPRKIRGRVRRGALAGAAVHGRGSRRPRFP